MKMPHLKQLLATVISVMLACRLFTSLFVVIALILGATLPACSKSNGNDTDSNVESSSPEVVTGISKRLEQFRGKVVLLDLWTTWCGPCRVEIPGLVNLQRKYADKGLEVVGVSLDPIDPRGAGGKSAVAPFIRKTGINYTVWVMEDLKALKDYQWDGVYPTTYLIDRDGRVLKKYIGAQSEETFEADLKSLLKGA